MYIIYMVHLKIDRYKSHVVAMYIYWSRYSFQLSRYTIQFLLDDVYKFRNCFFSTSTCFFSGMYTCTKYAIFVSTDVGMIGQHQKGKNNHIGSACNRSLYVATPLQIISVTKIRCLSFCVPIETAESLLPSMFLCASLTWGFILWLAIGFSVQW